MKLRWAHRDDAMAIAGLHTTNWRMTYQDCLSADYLEHRAQAEREALWSERLASNTPNQLVLVAEDNNSLIGFACAYIAKHDEWGSYLDNLHVSHHYRGHGIGQVLLEEIRQRCNQHTQGLGFYLAVTQTNHNAQAFYLAHGASNAAADIWDAPDGSQVPMFWFTWPPLRIMGF